jgi:DNA-binding transcriptional MerR regulator
LRYWEQEFTQLRPMKRRGNRRYYQHHEVLMVRRIRGLLYEQGFTISGARNQMLETAGEDRQFKPDDLPDDAFLGAADQGLEGVQGARHFLSASVRDELLQIRDLLAEAG